MYCIYSVAPISAGGLLSTGNSVKLIKFHHQKSFRKPRAFLNLPIGLKYQMLAIPPNNQGLLMGYL